MAKRYKPSMKINIFAIGGKFEAGPSGDEFIGTAHDPRTALSLINYVEQCGGYAVSLHGTGLNGIHDISETATLARARSMFVVEHHRNITYARPKPEPQPT
jgi:hypothetical protein